MSFFLLKKPKLFGHIKKKAVPLHRISIRDDVSRSRAVVARQAHNLKVGGSIPPSATKEKPLD